MKTKLLLVIILNLLLFYSDAQKKYISESINLYNELSKKYNLIDKKIELNYKGIDYIYGHFSTPDSKDTTINNCVIKYKNGYQFLNIVTEGKSYFIYKNDSLFKQEIDDSVYILLKSKEFYLEYFYNPFFLFEYIIKNKNTLVLLNDNIIESTFLFNNVEGLQFFVIYNKKIKSITKTWIRKYDPILGDLNEIIEYEYLSNNIFPNKIKHYNEYKVIRILNFNNKIEEPNNEENKNTLKLKVLKNFKIDTINDQTYLLKLLDFNNKVLIYKNQHSLSLFEAPLGYNVCTDIIKICNYYFKGYAIKNLFLSHHHPDHAGGISAFKNLDCNIITTKGNIKYFEKIINNSRYLNKNYSKLSNSNKFKFIIIQNDSNITIDGVRVFEIGRYTTHTKEHLVFLIPEDSLLFVSDLVVFPNGYVHNQSERAYSVYELINRENLEVNKIYTSWPLHGFKNFGTFEDLKSCLLKFIPIYK